MYQPLFKYFPFFQCPSQEAIWSLLAYFQWQAAHHPQMKSISSLENPSYTAVYQADNGVPWFPLTDPSSAPNNGRLPSLSAAPGDSTNFPTGPVAVSTTLQGTAIGSVSLNKPT